MGSLPPKQDSQPSLQNCLVGPKSNCRRRGRAAPCTPFSEGGIMKYFFVAASVLSVAALASTAIAQDKGAVVVSQTEAVVTVVKLDRKARRVTFQGPRGNQVSLIVPQEAQNLDQVRVGSLFNVKYVEAVAVSLQRGGQPSVGVDQTVRLAPKGGNPGGVVVNTAKIRATVVAIDYADREVAVKG